MPKPVASDLRKTIGNRVKLLIARENINQTDLSNALGVRHTTVSRIITGVGSPSLELLVRIADLFGVSTDYLLGRSFQKK